MTLSGSVRTLLARWYITVPGVLLSLALAGITFAVVPMQYSSTGTAVLVQPKKVVGEQANPFLNFDAGLATTALILQQQLSTPAIKPLIVNSKSDTFTVENAGSAEVSNQTVQPFLTVVTKSTSKDSATQIVERVLQLAADDLSERQSSMHVLAINRIKLANVIEPTLPKPVLITPLAATGAGFVLGLIVTFLVAMAVERSTVKRATRKQEVFATRAQEEMARRVVQWPQPADEDVVRPYGYPSPHRQPNTYPRSIHDNRLSS